MSFTRLGDVVDRELKRKGLFEVVGAALLCGRWQTAAETILGKDFLGLFKARSFKNGRLKVATRNAMVAAEIDSHKKEICDKLKEQNLPKIESLIIQIKSDIDE